jgi:hypothetical protein
MKKHCIKPTDVQFTDGTWACLTYEEALYKTHNGHKVKPEQLDKFPEYKKAQKVYAKRPKK